MKNALKTLFQEVFVGTPPGADGTWFVQGNEAMNATLAALSPEEASRKLAPNISSIAAHVIHATYYLELGNDTLRGVSREGDWKGSWSKQSVDDAEWKQTKADLGIQINRFLDFVDTGDIDCDEDTSTTVLANVCHAAYHLGAIRQIYLMVKSPVTDA